MDPSRIEMKTDNQAMRASLLLAAAVPICWCFSTAALSQPSKTGVLTGVVRYTGEVPPAKKVVTTDGNTIIHNDLVVDQNTNGLRFVAVILEDAPPQPKKKEKARTAVIDQRDMVFLPRLIAVQHGQTVRFENNDLCNHGVQAFAGKPQNEFNITTPPGQPFEFDFTPQKRPVMIGCQIHAWMRAWVYVLPHPYFSVTDARGGFRIDNIPPGKYTALLAHPDTNHQERHAVEIAPDKEARLQIEWKRVGKK